MDIIYSSRGRIYRACASLYLLAPVSEIKDNTLAVSASILTGVPSELATIENIRSVSLRPHRHHRDIINLWRLYTAGKGRKAGRC